MGGCKMGQKASAGTLKRKQVKELMIQTHCKFGACEAAWVGRGKWIVAAFTPHSSRLFGRLAGWLV